VKRYQFLPEALVEYEDAIEYYEHAQTGLGDTFIRQVDRAIALTLEFPDMGAVVAGTPPELIVRRRLVRRFGVELDYLISGDTLVVLALFHGRRRPGYWRERLERLR
jgi:plasmid stabilization system protein ParE